VLFTLANWIILGGAFYIIMDAIPNGPLSWKLLSKYGLQTNFAIKTLIALGLILLLIESFLIGLNYNQFVGEQLPSSDRYNFYLAVKIFSIPLVSQLFRIQTFKKSASYRFGLALVIIGSDLFTRFYNPFENPRRYYDYSDSSLISSITSSHMFHYICSILAFFIVLDVILILKKHKIMK